MRQTEMRFRTWGGARERAGRKPRGARAGVSHLARARFARTTPVHVTVRMAPHVYNLRSRRCFSAIGRALGAAAERFGVSIVQFSVQGNHVHLVVEASSGDALSRAMQGLSIRVAKGLNRVMRRRGRVLGDRYHARLLRTPTEVRRALAYVRDNARKHGAAQGGAPDAYASAGGEIDLPAPRTWLVRAGWRRAPP
jgi:putative transposase